MVISLALTLATGATVVTGPSRHGQSDEPVLPARSVQEDDAAWHCDTGSYGVLHHACQFKAAQR